MAFDLEEAKAPPKNEFRDKWDKLPPFKPPQGSEPPPPGAFILMAFDLEEAPPKNEFRDKWDKLPPFKPPAWPGPRLARTSRAPLLNPPGLLGPPMPKPARPLQPRARLRASVRARPIRRRPRRLQLRAPPGARRRVADVALQGFSLLDSPPRPGQAGHPCWPNCCGTAVLRTTPAIQRVWMRCTAAVRNLCVWRADPWSPIVQTLCTARARLPIPRPWMRCAAPLEDQCWSLAIQRQLIGQPRCNPWARPLLPRPLMQCVTTVGCPAPRASGIKLGGGAPP